MVWLVIGINLGICWGCWRLVSFLVGLRRTLVGVTRAIDGAERATHHFLVGAPQAIQRGQTGTRALRQRLPLLVGYLRQVQRLLTLLVWLRRLLRRWAVPNQR
ncbi:MAG: hypothetical protein RMI89_00875 [Gloeomargarita sp. SKYBB_i_bin120]|nr:hypothetical protein [Gloeomargarita sp. SKYG98]MCS7291514.1 hypothetical protein [Gloeomargarita sp. SKYB120]MDW8177074.1 hypothetical protein [Gloeomargarita sp. SKYBB_i_bin120]